MKKKSIVLAASLFTLTTPLPAEMYRYIDESGQVVYSQFRPDPQTEAATVKAPPPPPSTADQSRQQLINSLQQQQDDKQDRQEAAKKTAQLDAENERKKKNCAAARNNLQAFTAGGNKKIVDSQGNKLHLTEKNRKQQIQKAREAIARDCR